VSKALKEVALDIKEALLHGQTKEALGYYEALSDHDQHLLMNTTRYLTTSEQSALGCA
jgi:hypothetical protein